MLAPLGVFDVLAVGVPQVVNVFMEQQTLNFDYFEFSTRWFTWIGCREFRIDPNVWVRWIRVPAPLDFVGTYSPIEAVILTSHVNRRSAAQGFQGQGVAQRIGDPLRRLAFALLLQVEQTAGTFPHSAMEDAVELPRPHFSKQDFVTRKPMSVSTMSSSSRADNSAPAASRAWVWAGPSRFVPEMASTEPAANALQVAVPAADSSGICAWALQDRAEINHSEVRNRREKLPLRCITSSFWSRFPAPFMATRPTHRDETMHALIYSMDAHSTVDYARRKRWQDPRSGARQRRVA